MLKKLNFIHLREKQERIRADVQTSVRLDCVSNSTSELKLMPVTGESAWSWTKSHGEIYCKWKEYCIGVKKVFISHS